MLVDSLRALYAYNRWATEQVFEAAAKVTSEQLAEPGTAGHGSIFDTLFHLVEVQNRWLKWWDGSMSADAAYVLELDRERINDLPTLRAEWDVVLSQTGKFLEGLTDADAGRDYSNTLPNGYEFRVALWKMMFHVANHGTQHRSEAAAMLSGFGQSPGTLDQLNFYLMGG